MPKPLRRILIIVLIASMLALGVGGVLGWRWFSGVANAQPTLAVDYGRQRLELIEREQAEGANGWPMLLRAGELAVEIERRHFIDHGLHEHALADVLYWPHLLDGQSPGFAAEERARARAMIEEMEGEGLFGMLDLLGEHPRFVPPYSAEPLLYAAVPHLGAARALARVCRASAGEAAGRGDGAAFCAAVKQGLNVARAVSRGPTMIEHQVGIAISLAMMETIREAITSGSLQMDQERGEAARLIGELEEPILPPLHYVLQGERLMRLDSYQRVFSDDGRGGGQLLPLHFAEFFGNQNLEQGSNFAGAFLANRTQMMEIEMNMHTLLMQAAGSPPRQQHELMWHLGRLQEDLPPGITAASMLAPAKLYENFFAARSTYELQRAGTVIMLALEQYRAEHRRYPATLGALVPQYLPMLPADPYAGRFQYRLLAGDPHGRGYLLYSAGLDRIDRGGNSNERDHAAALRPGGSEYDFIINMPPAAWLARQDAVEADDPG